MAHWGSRPRLDGPGEALREGAQERLESGWKVHAKVKHAADLDLEQELKQELTRERQRARNARPCEHYFRTTARERLAHVERYTMDHFRTGVRPSSMEGLLFAAAPAVGEWQPCLAALREFAVDRFELVLMDAAVSSEEEWPRLVFADSADALSVRFEGGAGPASLWRFTLVNTTTSATWELGAETKDEAMTYVWFFALT